ncbi:MAG: flagellar biosynthesis protein FlhB [Defluviitaleaceae bacterium]|nr:flagellar biosynthesis protein FlhB [Defluviitaleaceae bacterium]
MELLRLNLSFFDDSEKTEPATAKKRSKARSEGQVVKSQEASTAAMLIFGFFALSAFAGGIRRNMLDLFTYHSYLFTPYMLDTIDQVDIARRISWLLSRVIWIAAPMFLVTVILGLVLNIYQVGWHPTTKPMKIKFSKMNPLKGFKRLFSLQSLVNFIKSLLKLFFVGAVVYSILSGEIETLPSLLGMSFIAVISYFAKLVIKLGISVGVLFILIAIFDYAYTKWKHEKDIKMSKHEVKEEWKQMEGDPKVKAKIKQKMREASMRRMMKNVPNADVIITNPTHYAVALKYDIQGAGGAPVLVGKGVDFMAKRIREAGIENDIPIVENPPLARTLYAEVEIDQEIPEELYVAVAEIMAYVFKLKGRVANE